MRNVDVFGNRGEERRQHPADQRVLADDDLADLALEAGNDLTRGLGIQHLVFHHETRPVPFSEAAPAGKGDRSLFSAPEKGDRSLFRVRF
jgi:hypothetical protein